MKTHALLALLLGVALGASSFGADTAKPAEPAKKAPAAKPTPPVKPPTELELRAVLTKSLGFLAKEGDEWIADKNCNGCHHMPELIWSHREAKLRGFPVDQKKFDEWVSWADSRASDKKPGLEEAALMILAMPQRQAPELTKLLVSEQRPDGSWNPAGQFSDMQKRGAPDARANSTHLNLLALATALPAAAEAGTAQTKAAAVLQKKDTPSATESLVYRVLFARQTGKTAEADPLLAQLLKQQRGDGGWSSIIGENMSDPLATGQVLYVLQPSATDPKTADAIARAQLWLAKTQLPDGSWPTDITHVSKLDRSAASKNNSFKAVTEIYHFWGTSWATIGLLQSVPAK